MKLKDCLIITKSSSVVTGFKPVEGPDEGWLFDSAGNALVTVEDFNKDLKKVFIRAIEEAV